MGGALLVFAYLVLPPSAALLLARRLWLVVLLSVAFALACTGIGLYTAYRYDLPTNHVVAVAASGVLVLAAVLRGMASLVTRRRAGA